ncbi:MAG: dihydrolipoyl dehydrogenase [Myxococcota bacterium]
MADKTYDIIVIGAGPGGYPAAIRAAQLGLETLCVDKEYLGGVCLNWGCIPSKALIAAANLAHKTRNAEGMGIKAQVEVDVGQMQQWKNGIVNKLTGGVGQLIKGNGGEWMIGEAKLTGKSTVQVTDGDGKTSTYEARKGILVATGAQVIQIPGFEPDGEDILTAREAINLPEVPENLVLIGGGYIGLELGMVYQKLGSKLTVVEMTDQLMPTMDADLVKVVEKHLKKDGADILLEAKATGYEKKKNGKLVVTVEHKGEKKQIEADKILVAVGFKPSSKNLGLEELGVKTDDKGHIQVDDTLQTNIAGVYAAGDVARPPYLAHKATKEGEVAAEVIAGHKSAADWRALPAAVFTHPEIATVGLSEKQAKEQGREVLVGKFPFSVSGRAMSVMETDGFVKVLADPKSHEVLGMAVVGPDASDLIAEPTLAMEMSAFVEDVALTIHTHPTLAEATMEAFKHAIGEAIHVMNRKRK